jgi:uncharacterized protein (TIGR03067 family)
MIKRFACLLVVGLLMGADQPSDAAKKDLEKLQGDWKVEKAQRGGMDAPANVLEKLTLVVKGDSMTVSEGGVRDEKAAITLDPGKSPAAIDIKPARAGRDTVLGIYKLDGDSLTLCWAKDGARPTDFASKEGSNHVLFVLKRIKK